MCCSECDGGVSGPPQSRPLLCVVVSVLTRLPRLFQPMCWRCIWCTLESASTVCSSKCVNTSPRVLQRMCWRCIWCTLESASTVCSSKCVNTSPRLFQPMCWRCIWCTLESACTVCNTKCVNTSPSCVAANVLEVYLVHLRVGLYCLFHRLYGMYPCHFLTYLRDVFTKSANRHIFNETIEVSGGLFHCTYIDCYGCNVHLLSFNVLNFSGPMTIKMMQIM